MTKGSNYLFSFAFLSLALLASGLNLAFFPISFAVLGCAKLVNGISYHLPSPWSRIGFWIHALVFEVLAVIFTFCLKWSGLRGKVSGLKKGRPVLLIHGYLQNGSNWIFLKPMLCQKGLGPIYTLDLRPHFGSIAGHAEQVKKKAIEIAKETGRSDLTLIGHSMGGLVSAWYAAKLAPLGTVGDVITIGSPLGGTRMAAIALGANGREMRLKSDFTQELQKAVASDTHTRYFHIGSKADQIILPTSSARLGLQPDQEYFLEDLGHMSLLFSRRIAAKIGAWLTVNG